MCHIFIYFILNNTLWLLHNVTYKIMRLGTVNYPDKYHLNSQSWLSDMPYVVVPVENVYIRNIADWRICPPEHVSRLVTTHPSVAAPGAWFGCFIARWVSSCLDSSAGADRYGCRLRSKSSETRFRSSWVSMPWPGSTFASLT